MRRTLELLAIFTLALLVSVAYGQTPTNTQKVSWVAPTQYTDGTTIPSTVALTYNVYAKLGGAAETKIRAAITGTSITAGAYPVGQSNCYTITVLANGVESARSAEACAVVQALATKAVTTVVIQ
jgi:hypothetical protein